MLYNPTLGCHHYVIQYFQVNILHVFRVRSLLLMYNIEDKVHMTTTKDTTHGPTSLTYIL